MDIISEGIKKYNLGEYEEAIRCFDTAIQLGYQNEQVFHYIGMAQLKLDEYYINKPGIYHNAVASQLFFKGMENLAKISCNK